MPFNPQVWKNGDQSMNSRSVVSETLSSTRTPVKLGTGRSSARHSIGVRPAGGCPTDQKRQFEALALHLSGHMYHLVERRRNQPAESDQIGVFGLGAFQDPLARDHYTHVDHFVVI